MVCITVGASIGYFETLESLVDSSAPMVQDIGPSVLQIGISLVAGLIMAIPFVLDRVLYDRFGDWQKILFFPFLCASLEVLQALTPIGNINSLAYSQIYCLDSLQMVSVIGSTGLTFMICLFGSAVSFMALGYESERKMDRRALACIVVVIIAILAGTVRLSVEDPSDDRVSVLCTEGPGIYILDSEKGTVTYEENVAYFDRTLEIAVQEGVTVLCAAEDAYRMDQSYVDMFRAHVEQRAAESGLYVLYGMGINEGNEQIWNVCSFVNPSGKTEWTYAKTHIMPIDEECRYSGDGTFYHSETEFGCVTSMICMDLEYPAFASGIDDSADILMAISYDWKALEGWHTRNTSLRAIENGVSYLRNTSNGTIGTYDYLGHEIKQANYRGDAQDYYIMDVPTDSSQTVFGTYGGGNHLAVRDRADIDTGAFGHSNGTSEENDLTVVNHWSVSQLFLYASPICLIPSDTDFNL